MKFFLIGNYSKSDSSLDPIMMPVVTDQEILNAIAHSYYDYSMIDSYSDLSYGFLNLSLGIEYKFSKSTTFIVDVNYYDLKGYENYVYGDESGSFYTIRTGFRFGSNSLF
jgi:hypothetical protein